MSQEDVMRGLKASFIVSVVLLGCAGMVLAQPERFSQSSIIQLQRDSLYEQHLKYQASVDKAITPARVLALAAFHGRPIRIGRPFPL